MRGDVTQPVSESALADSASNPGPGLPFLFFLGLLSGLVLYLVAQAPLLDGDLYWHLLAGEELLSGSSPWGIGEDWVFGPSNEPWTSTQWLAEILLFLLQTAGSWTALAAFRVVTAAAAMAILAWNVLRPYPPRAGALPFATAAAAVAFVSQERPQQFTLIGTAALGGVLATGLLGKTLPSWWLVFPATLLWANVHGGWVLVPVVFGLISAGQAIETRDLRNPVVGRSLRLAVIAVAAGMLTPAGPGGLLAPLRFSAATTNIIEWGAVQPVTTAGAATLVMLALFAFSWAKGTAISIAEPLVVATLFVFSWAAWRNVAPGLALLAPLCAHRLSATFPWMAQRREPRWSAPAGVATAAALAVAGLLTLPGREHLPYDENPVRLAEEISTLPSGQRVLNDYNVSGLVLYFGGPSTTVAIDGRADKFGADYIHDYLSLENLQGDWETLLANLDPTSALIEEDSAIAHLLMSDRGWTVIGADGDYVLLGDPSMGIIR